MDAGRAVLGQGWPVTACPRSGTGAREPERSEGRTQGQGLFGYFCGCLTKVPRRKGETRRKIQCIEWICTLANKKLRVHIRYMCLAELRVTPLRRVTLQKRQSNQNASAPAYGPRCAQVSLAPVPLRGHAVTGHPWPNTALPASMPVDPLRETSSRPPEGAADQKPDQKQITRPRFINSSLPTIAQVNRPIAAFGSDYRGVVADEARRLRSAAKPS